MIGAVRPLARYAAPSAWMNRTGDVEVESLPLPDGPAPTTEIAGLTPFSASYAAASSFSYAAADACEPSGPNCGCQKNASFGSLPTM